MLMPRSSQDSREDNDSESSEVESDEAAATRSPNSLEPARTTLTQTVAAAAISMGAIPEPQRPLSEVETCFANQNHPIVTNDRDAATTADATSIPKQLISLQLQIDINFPSLNAPFSSVASVSSASSSVPQSSVHHSPTVQLTAHALVGAGRQAEHVYVECECDGGTASGLSKQPQTKSSSSAFGIQPLPVSRLSRLSSFAINPPRLFISNLTIRDEIRYEFQPEINKSIGFGFMRVTA